MVVAYDVLHQSGVVLVWTYVLHAKGDVVSTDDCQSKTVGDVYMDVVVVERGVSLCSCCCETETMSAPVPAPQINFV